MMIYQRNDDEEPLDIENFNMVMKGKWNMGAEESEEFMYKKIDRPENEDLLQSLYVEDVDDRVGIPDFTKNKVFDATDYQQIHQRFQCCQGFYRGYFKYNKVQTTEK